MSADADTWNVDSVRSAIDTISSKLSELHVSLWDVEVFRHPFDGRSAVRLTVPLTTGQMPPKQEGEDWTTESVREAVNDLSAGLSKMGLFVWDVAIFRHPFDGRSAVRLTVPLTPSQMPPKQPAGE